METGETGAVHLKLRKAHEQSEPWMYEGALSYPGRILEGRGVSGWNKTRLCHQKNKTHKNVTVSSVLWQMKTNYFSWPIRWVLVCPLLIGQLSLNGTNSRDANMLTIHVSCDHLVFVEVMIRDQNTINSIQSSVLMSRQSSGAVAPLFMEIRKYRCWIKHELCCISLCRSALILSVTKLVTISECKFRLSHFGSC